MVTSKVVWKNHDYVYLHMHIVVPGVQLTSHFTFPFTSTFNPHGFSLPLSSNYFSMVSEAGFKKAGIWRVSDVKQVF